MRAVGKVTYIDEHTFSVDDGSGVNVRCETPSALPASESWDLVSVTGVSAINKTGDGVYERLLRVTEVNAETYRKG